MELNYERARHLKGKMIQYKNADGEWVVAKVTNVRKDGLEVEELRHSSSHDGHGFGFFRRRPFFSPFFLPFGFRFFPFFI
ncbi:hypothetical protein F7731_12580 [Cytobacillus depressus]|uniref:Uncharacterized protein n=1 Tax=Cytobacillus depressus TaxID=1602942 RepID=A0A6L3VAA7_9BACI|nr:hypothetical protein [Cytobacillus depressus]KAB2336317.1 hypothetical protein F7731_12580 [Cytobacillus depressus]